MNVLLIETPFHFYLLKKMVEHFDLSANNTIVFIGDLIDKKEVEKLFNGKAIYHMPLSTIKLKNLIKLKGIKELQVYYEKSRELIDSVISDRIVNLIARVICFSDRGLFIQLLCERIKEEVILIAIEEGTGYYKKFTFLDSLLQILYKIVTPILLKGFVFNYYLLGKNTRTNRVYVRYIDKIIDKRKVVEYRDLLKYFEYRDNGIEVLKDSVKILILTNPLSENKFMSEKKECELICSILNFLQEKDIEIYIKPHPRENIKKYKNISLKYILLEQSIPSEEINCFEYSYIIHFCSSAILNFMDKGYPKNRIFTYPCSSHAKRVVDLFIETNFINKIDDIKIEI